MYFTFSEESSYGVDATNQQYVVDLVSEEVITNVNYEKVAQFNYPTSKARIPTLMTGKGRVGFEMTYGNEAWNVLFKSILGTSVVLSDTALVTVPEPWKVLTGMLSADLNNSDIAFTINEYDAGDFDNVDGIIIDKEYIAVGSITNGVVTGATRASGTSTAASHRTNALVYGLVSNGGSSVNIISRNRSGFCYTLPTSLTTLIYREGDYYEYKGSILSDFVFNAGMDSLTVSFEMHSQNVRVINLSNPSTAVDNGQMVSPNDINAYSMGESIGMKKLYMQISNTLMQGPAKFFDTTYGEMLLQTHSAYGQFTTEDEGIGPWNQYLQDDELNLSVTMCDNNLFDNAFVFAFNRVRYGTMLRILYSKIDLLGDSVPYFSYDPDGFNIIIQTNTGG